MKEGVYGHIKVHGHSPCIQTDILMRNIDVDPAMDDKTE